MLLRRWSVLAGLWTTGEVSLRFFRLILCVPMQDVFLVGAVVLHFVEYRLPLILRILHGHFFRSALSQTVSQSARNCAGLD